MLSDKILAKIQPDEIELTAALWGGRLAKHKAVGNVENLVYACHPGFALRCVSHQHRSEAALEAELAWLSDLKAAGLPVVEILPSLNHELLETVTLGDHVFYCSAFRWIEGQSFHSEDTPDFWCVERIIKLGETVARLHQQTRKMPEFLKKKCLARQGPFDQFSIPAAVLEQVSHATRFEALYAKLQTKWQHEKSDTNRCGLIHGDLHSGNFIVESSGELTVFDFDDAHHGWWTQDIAIALYYLSRNLLSQKEVFNIKHWQAFKAGYTSLLCLPPDFSEDCFLFLHWREWQLLGFLFNRFQRVESFPESAKKAYVQICDNIENERTSLYPLQYLP